MDLLIDTNILLDYLLTREPGFQAASKIMEKCAIGEVNGYIAFHSVSILWYLLRKRPEAERRQVLSMLLHFLRVVSASHEEVVKAIGMYDFRDFEDCLQDRCATSAGADYIITRNVADFAHSEVPAVSPEEYLNLSAV